MMIAAGALLVAPYLFINQSIADPSSAQLSTEPSNSTGISIQGLGADNQGAAVFSVPFEVPRSRSGLIEPNVILDYNSNGAISAYGVGWALQVPWIEETRVGRQVESANHLDSAGNFSDRRLIYHLSHRRLPMQQIGANPDRFRGQVQRIDLEFVFESPSAIVASAPTGLKMRFRGRHGRFYLVDAWGPNGDVAEYQYVDQGGQSILPGREDTPAESRVLLDAIRYNKGPADVFKDTIRFRYEDAQLPVEGRLEAYRVDRVLTSILHLSKDGRRNDRLVKTLHVCTTFGLGSYGPGTHIQEFRLTGFEQFAPTSQVCAGQVESRPRTRLFLPPQTHLRLEDPISGSVEIPEGDLCLAGSPSCKRAGLGLRPAAGARHREMMVDVNGDGKVDILEFYFDVVDQVSPVARITAYINESTADVIRFRATSFGDGIYVGYIGGGGSSTQFEMVDMDGDGLVDILPRTLNYPPLDAEWPEARSRHPLRWYRNVKTHFERVPSEWRNGERRCRDRKRVIDEGDGTTTKRDLTSVTRDVTGDGVIDCVVVEDEGWLVYPGYVKACAACDGQCEFESGFSQHAQRWDMSDLENAGLKIPIPIRMTRSKNVHWTVEDRDGVQTDVLASLIDVNGDGLLDYVTNSEVFINTGEGGFRSSATWSVPRDVGTRIAYFNYVDEEKAKTLISRTLRDVDGDGFPDLVFVEGDGDERVIRVIPNSGSGWHSSVYTLSAEVIRGVETTSVYTEDGLMDLNGDGRLDRFSSFNEETGEFQVELGSSAALAARRVVEINNGMSLRQRLDYTTNDAWIDSIRRPGAVSLSRLRSDYKDPYTGTWTVARPDVDFAYSGAQPVLHHCSGMYVNPGAHVLQERMIDRTIRKTHDNSGSPTTGMRREVLLINGANEAPLKRTSVTYDIAVTDYPVSGGIKKVFVAVPSQEEAYFDTSGNPVTHDRREVLRFDTAGRPTLLREVSSDGQVRFFETEYCRTEIKKPVMIRTCADERCATILHERRIFYAPAETPVFGLSLPRRDCGTGLVHEVREDYYRLPTAQGTTSILEHTDIDTERYHYDRWGNVVRAATRMKAQWSTTTTQFDSDYALLPTQIIEGLAPGEPATIKPNYPATTYTYFDARLGSDLFPYSRPVREVDGNGVSRIVSVNDFGEVELEQVRDPSDAVINEVRYEYEYRYDGYIVTSVRDGVASRIRFDALGRKRVESYDNDPSFGGGVFVTRQTYPGLVNPVSGARYEVVREGFRKDSQEGVVRKTEYDALDRPTRILVAPYSPDFLDPIPMSVVSNPAIEISATQHIYDMVESGQRRQTYGPRANDPAETASNSLVGRPTEQVTSLDGRILRIRDKRGVGVDFTYNINRHLTEVARQLDLSEIDPDRRPSCDGPVCTHIIEATNAFIRDGRGRRLQLSDPNQGIYRYEYDFSNNLEEIYRYEHSLASDPLEKTTHEYDLLSRRTVSAFARWNPTTQMLVTDPDFTYALTYDSVSHQHDPAQAGLLVGRLSGFETQHFRVGFGYDDGGRETYRSVVPYSRRVTSAGFAQKYEVAYDRDSEGRVRFVVVDGVPLLEKRYDGNGRIREAISLLNGHTILSVASRAGPRFAITRAHRANARIEDKRSYDGLGRTRSYELMMRGMGLLSRRQFVGFDANSNPTRIYRTDGHQTVDLDYAYDFREQLAQATAAGAASYDRLYSYDSLGNLREIADAGVGTPVRTLSYRDDGTVPDLPQQVIDSGGMRDLDWHLGRWRQELQSCGGAGCPSLALADYGAGNRLTRYQRNGSTHEYLYGPHGKLAALGSKDRLFLGSGIQAKIDRNSGTHEVVVDVSDGEAMVGAISVGSTSVEVEHFVTDQHGTVTAAYDEQGLRLFSKYFMPFGEVIWNQASGPNSGRGFGSGISADRYLVPMGERDYLPQLGRFAQADPILPDAGRILAFNRYTYAYNNPIIYSDPTGEVPGLLLGFLFNVLAALLPPEEGVDYGQSVLSKLVGATISLALNFVAEGLTTGFVKGLPATFSSSYQRNLTDTALLTLPRAGISAVSNVAEQQVVNGRVTWPGIVGSGLFGAIDPWIQLGLYNTSIPKADRALLATGFVPGETSELGKLLGGTSAGGALTGLAVNAALMTGFAELEEQAVAKSVPDAPVFRGQSPRTPIGERDGTFLSPDEPGRIEDIHRLHE